MDGIIIISKVTTPLVLKGEPINTCFIYLISYSRALNKIYSAFYPIKVFPHNDILSFITIVFESRILKLISSKRNEISVKLNEHTTIQRI